MLVLRSLSKLLAGTAAVCALSAGTAWAEAPKVVSSIAPVHALVQSVLGGEGEAELLVKGTASPHGFSLKPSQLRSLSDANVIFWIGPELEGFMPKVLKSQNLEKVSFPLIKAEGIHLTTVRSLEKWERKAHDHDEGDHGDHAGHDEDHHDEHKSHGEHAHEDDHQDHKDDHHGHDGHDDHKEEHHAEAHHDEHDDHGDHGHEEAGHEEAGHEEGEHHDEHGHEGHHHAPGSTDPHIWLDPFNAIAMVNAIEQTLVLISPENGDVYKANAEKLRKDLKALDSQIKADLAPVKDAPFVVYHDAYQYFESHYGLNSIGAVTLDPERGAGAKHLAELRHEIEENKVRCLFVEPQFKGTVGKRLAADLDLKVASIDPLGTSGGDLVSYEKLLENLTSNLVGCLAP